jgi:hypothetical protein
MLEAHQECFLAKQNAKQNAKQIEISLAKQDINQKGRAANQNEV